MCNMIADWYGKGMVEDDRERLALLLVDHKKAFPSVIRGIFYDILSRLGFPPLFVDLVRLVHDTAEYYINYGGEV